MMSLLTCLCIKRILHIMVLILMTTFAPALSCTNQGYIVKEAHYVPQNEQEYWKLTKDIKCSKLNLKVTYLINMWKNRTIIGCFRDEKIYGGYCAELNNGSELRVQPNHAAPCLNFTNTPCKKLYYSSQSYLYRQCFEEYGNISSPLDLFLENENLHRIENELKKVIQTYQKQNYSLLEQIRKNGELIKIQEINITNMELIIKNLIENVHNKEQCEPTDHLSVCFLLFLVTLVILVLGTFFLFILHKYVFKDVITLSEFCHQRWMLTKAWFLTNNKRKQLLRPFVMDVESEQEPLRRVDMDGNYDDRKCFDPSQGKNDLNKVQELKESAEVIDHHHHHHEVKLDPEEADELCKTVTHITRNEDEPESEGENANIPLILGASEKMTRKVWDDK
ncbi:uncharacterized protein LOC133178736 [Saccostrea echinata]|uniref:uncharacterized protein LOC133178736 n=1 Tax=Saccostrea echinata TaxID=191078 RepID=UPI002A7FB345|nr:uncharacterized protein LOC133178736 [Saccostrea echinata]